MVEKGHIHAHVRHVCYRLQLYVRAAVYVDTMIFTDSLVLPFSPLPLPPRTQITAEAAKPGTYKHSSSSAVSGNDLKAFFKIVSKAPNTPTNLTSLTLMGDKITDAVLKSVAKELCGKKLRKFAFSLGKYSSEWGTSKVTVESIGKVTIRLVNITVTYTCSVWLPLGLYTHALCA